MVCIIKNEIKMASGIQEEKQNFKMFRRKQIVVMTLRQEINF